MEFMDGSSRIKLESLVKPLPRTKVSVIPSPPDYPRSHAANYESTTPVTSEEKVLRAAKVRLDLNRVTAPKLTKSQRESRRATRYTPHDVEGQVIIIELSDFEIYRCPVTDKKRKSELIGLNLFDIKGKSLCLDGSVQIGNQVYYVEGLNIDDISIDGYGSDSDPNITAYIQTVLAKKDSTSNVWLRLQEPALQYERFHSPFMWVAKLCKHTVDFMDNKPEGTVGLPSFKQDFYAWLVQRFGSNEDFRQWASAFNNATDFQVAFHAHKDFFYNQAVNLSTSQHLLSHPIWADCMCDRRLAVARQPNLVKYTITTPHVYECFRHMYFSKKLRLVSPFATVSHGQWKRKVELGFAEDHGSLTLSQQTLKIDTNPSSAQVGDVISVAPDETDKFYWKQSGNEWLAYVQGIDQGANGEQRIMVLWLYRPTDTNMFVAEYPVKKELFLSDNCNCGQRKLLISDVLRKHTVAWSPNSLNTIRDLIIRQTYMTNDSAFMTVKDEHKICACRKAKPRTIRWLAGDTVYVKRLKDGQKVLEPVVIHEIDQGTNLAKVRTLLRLERDCADLALQAGRDKIAPNELVLTGKVQTISLSRIQRPCHVRLIPRTDVISNNIPHPYNLGGAGDYWFISMGLASIDNISERLTFLERLPDGIHETRMESLPYKVLRGLSLFSGGGGLDRGLEQGGAVEFQTAVDYDSAAIHTQRANCRDPETMRLFCGSVDDYLSILFSGVANHSVARVGEVEVIVASSPCPGLYSPSHILNKDF